MNPLARAAAWLLRGYQVVLSPLWPRACRYEPTCSEYARQSMLAHGLGRGSWLAVRRLFRCHPFQPGGFDPPPAKATPSPTEDVATRWKSERSWPPS